MLEIGAATGVAAGASALANRARSLEKAGLIVVEGDPATRQLKFAYNPTELSTSKSAKWNRPTTDSAKSATPAQFGGVEPQTLSMELFFDAWEDQGDVSKRVATLFEWLKPTKSSIQRKWPSPPILAFQWGADEEHCTDFRGYLQSVNAKYTLFRSDGVPLRATASIQLHEFPPEEKKQNPTSGARQSHGVTS